MSMDPMKNCTPNDCTVKTKEKRLSFKDGYQEEQEIKTIDLCTDPCCSNVQQKKIVDLSQGLSQLENILKNMTGLCREPKCPSKNLIDEKMIDSTLPNIPLPSRYYPEDVKQNPIGTEKESRPCSGSKILRDISDYKPCKGSVCYNAYMGYKIEPKNKDDQSGSKKTEPKKICEFLTCPFGQKPTDGYATTSNYTPKPTTMGPCGGFTCKSDLYSSTFTSRLPTTNVFNDLQPSYLPPTTGGQTFNKQDIKTKQDIPVGLCGTTSCPYASLEYAQRLSQLGNKNNTTQASTAPGGSSCCPFSDPQTKLCGDPNCPFAQKNPGAPKVKPHTTTTYSNFGETPYEPVGLCGDPCCPLLSKTSPGAVKPCPFADQVKRYPCGSPSCPYVNPSGMLHTHEYSYDRSYVQEAARPYCGSASPFDYMSSLTPSYPTPLATNYPLFSYTEPPKIPSCPYMAKKQKKSCGKPTCPYAQESDNFCIDKTCPYGESQSSESKTPTPKKKKDKCSCCAGDHYDDESDEPAHKEKKKKKKRSTCCRMSDVEEVVEEEEETTVPKSYDFCGSPICQGSRRSSSQKRQSSNLSGTIGERETRSSGDTAGNKPEAGPCSSKTCPYLKKLVFCDDCGGVLPDEETPTDSTTAETVNVSMEGEAGTPTNPTESEIKNNSQIETNKKRLSKQKDLVPLKKGFTPESEETAPVRCTISLYDYPGVQIGHRDCYFRRKKVPRNMGWLWNLMPSFDNPEHWRGYKPGAIRKSVYKIIKRHRREYDANLMKNKKVSRSRMRMMDLKHCIEVKKKEGEYHITVNPVKDPKARNPTGDPYMDVTPIQFKVEKEKPDTPYCPCDEIEEKMSEVSTEFDFHFTPPAAIPDLYPKKKKNTAAVTVQYDVMDLPPELRGTTGKNAKSGKSGKGTAGKKGKGKKK